MDAYMLTILVTGVQEDAIKDLFQCRGWKYDRNGAAPLLMGENLHKYGAGKQSDVSPRNLHQNFPLPYLEQHSHCVPFENVTGAPGYNSHERVTSSSSLVAVPFNMVDKSMATPSIENTPVFQNNQVHDFPMSVSVHGKIHTHTTELNHFALCDETSKQYCMNSEDVGYITVEASYDTCIDVNQKSVSGSLPKMPECLKTVDTDVPTSSNNEETKVSCKQFVSESQYDQLNVTGNKEIQAELVNVAVGSNYTGIGTAACNETVTGDVPFVDSDVVSVSNSTFDTFTVPGAGICSTLEESIFSSRYLATDNSLQKFDEKLLLNDFEIICEFIKNVKKFEYDCKFIQPKLKEIFEVLKFLLGDNVCSIKNLIDKSSLGEERELESKEIVKRFSCKTGTGYNVIKETTVCDTDNKVRVKDDVEPIPVDTSHEGSVSDTDIDSKAVKMEFVNMNAGGYCKKKLKEIGKKRKLKGLGNIKRRKRMRQKILNSHELNQETFSATDSIKDKRILYLSEEKGKSEDKKKMKKSESAKFRWTVNRNRRMHKYHRKCETVPLDLDTDHYSAIEKGFYCPDCKFIFKGKNKLILHKRLKKGYCLPDCIYCDADNQKEVFQCSKCPKCFQTKEMLERHEDKHVNFLSCSFCEYEFYTPKDLKLHLQTKHETALKMYLCDLCGAKFKERKVLNAHRRFVHSDERPEVCPSCNKCFKTKSQLKNHLVTHKTVFDLNLSCEICGKMFLRVATLKDHVRRHKKEFTCFCTICNKGFYRKYGLEEHMRVHTGDKPFDCKVCGFKCALSCNLVKHMKVHQKYDVK